MIKNKISAKEGQVESIWGRELYRIEHMDVLGKSLQCLMNSRDSFDLETFITVSTEASFTLELLLLKCSLISTA